jgi:hypothetical protein
MCYCDVTTDADAIFRAIDVTNTNATIEDATTDEHVWTELVYLLSVPSGCEQLNFRLMGVGSDDITYWDDFQVWHGGNGVYQCPSWLTRPSQMLGVCAFPQGTSGPASDNDYRANEQMSVPLNWKVEREDIRADKPLHLWVEGTGGRRPYIYALRPLSELSTDSATTTADKDRIVHWAERLIRDPEKASETLALLRGTALSRPVTTLPTRVGARSG